MRNLVVSGVKTAVQFVIAATLAWLSSVGIDVAGEAAQALETGLFAVVVGAVTALLNWLGGRYPIVNRIVSLGLTGGTATY